MIDDFSLDQAAGTELGPDGSFLFDSRLTTIEANDGGYSSIAGGTLTISKSTSFRGVTLLYLSVGGGPDLSACTTLVLENVTQGGSSPVFSIKGSGDTSAPIGGTPSGSSLVFDISGVSTAIRSAPTYLQLEPASGAVASAIVAAGPLIAQ